MKYFALFIASLLLFLESHSQSIDQKVDSVLNLMTLEEKVGQMTQVERTSLENLNDIATFGIGSILSGGGSAPDPNTRASWADMYDAFQNIALNSNLGIPIIYGVDAVHGHNNVYGAVIFPHNIGLGCTWNADLIKNVNQIVAKEVAATGIDWTFHPCIAVPRNEKWGRTYEGFGETAEIQKLMAETSVQGLQGNNLSLNTTVLACAKHFVGDGGTTNGIDQGNTLLSEDSLRAIHMQGYIDAIDAGVGSVMASYNSWNGEKLHGHQYLLSQVLKSELGFEGFVISDWKGVDQIDEDYRTAIKRAINAGIDMVMVPDRYEVFINHLVSLVEDNEVSEYRIDDAVRRILKQKFLLNLFDEPYTDETFASTFGSQAHRDTARKAVRESMVVLNAKNDILPLQKNDQTILVAGELANDLGAQCGGWTIYWQGGNGEITEGTTILEGIRNAVGNSDVVFSPNGDNYVGADVAVVVIGEKVPYTEGAGDRTSLRLDQTDFILLKKLKQAGIPTITLLISGRPLIIGDALPFTDALIALWYPGTEGDGVADVLFGDYLPAGKLTHSWPREMAQIPINFGDVNYNPLYEYKHGLMDFPSNMLAEELAIYAASTNKAGNEIQLALSAKVTELDATPSNFELFINGEIAPGFIHEISLASYDKSILSIQLDSAIYPGENITISYEGTGITANSLNLENFTDYYVFNSALDLGTEQEIPGRIEAENYTEMYGIQIEACSDIGGGENVGYFDAGDWLRYYVYATQTGEYKMNCRMSGYAFGTLGISFNDTIHAEVTYASTAGWQNWQDFETTVYLEKGTYIMEVLAQTDAFNINYFDFELINTSIPHNNLLINTINVYPNPMNDQVKLEFNSKTIQNSKIALLDATGKFKEILYQGKITQGANTFSFEILTNLNPGIYFIEIKGEDKRYFKKIIKN